MISIQIAKPHNATDVSLPRLKKLVRGICKRFDVNNASISLAIISDYRIRTLNARYMDRNGTTDCLSFDLSDTAGKSQKAFEIVVNGEKAVKQARLRGHTPEAEVALYVTHGLLHNLGFNDVTEDQAERMHQTEDEILRRFGYGVVYNSNDRS